MNAAKANPKRITITFEPDLDVWEKLREADKRGRGVRSQVINLALRKSLAEVVAKWDAAS
jgi:hypothetical protein